MTASQLAKEINISPPTVIRFAKKIGFRSFTDFKLNLSAEVWQPSKVVGYTDVLSNETALSLKNKMAHNTQITIQETTDILDEQVLLEVVELLEKHSVLILSGIGASQLVAEDIRQKFSRIGKTVILENDYNAVLPQFINGEGQVVIWLLSNSGETPEIVNLGEYAKNMNIPIISLTRLGNNTLSRIADVSLQVSRPKEALQRSAATNSIFAHLLAVDIVFYLYISRNEENAEKIVKSKQIIDSYHTKYF